MGGQSVELFEKFRNEVEIISFLLFYVDLPNRQMTKFQEDRTRKIHPVSIVSFQFI